MKPTFEKILQHWLTPALACLFLAAFGGVWAYSMIANLYAYRSPLQNAPPPPLAAQGKPAVRQVVFVLIDGLRYDTSLDGKTMPTLAALREVGASARMTSRAPSYSQPGYATLLTGAWPFLNDSPIVNVEEPDIWTFTQDNLFSAAQRAGLKTALSGYSWFEKLVPQDALAAHFYTSGEDNTADRAVVDAALPWLGDGPYQFVFIHIDQVDYAGHHEGGPIDPRWNAAAARSDQLLAEISARLDLQRDLLFVCSDHGHIARGGHGGSDADVLVEPFVLAGKGVRPGDYNTVEMVDVAPTLAAVLGINQPASSVGSPQTRMFNLPPEWALLNATLAETQQSALLLAYRSAVGAPPELGSIAAVQAWLVSRGFALRLALALLCAALAIWLVAARWPAGLGWLLAGALLSVLVFHGYYTFVAQRAYSLSAVDSQTQLIGTAAVGALAGFLLAAVLVLAGLWRRKDVRLARAMLLLALLAAAFQALPLLWNFVNSGWQISGVLPELFSAFLSVLSAAQILVTCLAGLVLAGLVWLGEKAAPRPGLSRS